jgi:dCMP deaminase
MSNAQRPDWDVYFMGLASAAATRATCDRLSVGCVITKYQRIVSSGYNGSLKGAAHCSGKDGVGHFYINGDESRGCQRTIHAEMNAIAHANTSLEGATLYVTHFPCMHCMKLIASVGIKKVFYREEYRSSVDSKELADMFGIEYTQIQKTP